MAVVTGSIGFETEGGADVIDITQQVVELVRETELAGGTVTVFTPSATSGLTTIEFESGAVSDFQRLFDEVAAQERHYAHNARWGDGNGHSHVRAALLGPSLTVPFVEGRLTLGTWQQIVFVDFDNRPRRRELVVQVVGE